VTNGLKILAESLTHIHNPCALRWVWHRHQCLHY